MKTSITSYTPKRILNTYRYCDGGWFWVKYSAHPYLGCAFGCQYCYEWDKKYASYLDPENFDRLLKVKKNAGEILAQELAAKPVDLITLGDWQPIETKYRLSRAMLRVVLELGFPVFINEKSPVVLKDLNLLKTINERSYANVGFSIITTQDDETSKIFEPKTPSIKSRFEAMEKIAAAGIMTGTVFMPILPYIYDHEENIKRVVKMTKEAGGKYVLDAGLTLHGFSKVKFYTALEKYDKKLIDKYEKIYQDPDLMQNFYRTVHSLVKKYCQEFRIANTIPRPVDFFPKNSRVNKLVAEQIFIQARELQLQGEPYYRVLAYLKAARELDEIDYDVFTLYQEKGNEGLLKIPQVGDKLANVIGKVLTDF